MSSRSIKRSRLSILKSGTKQLSRICFSGVEQNIQRGKITLFHGNGTKTKTEQGQHNKRTRMSVLNNISRATWSPFCLLWKTNKQNTWENGTETVDI